eukprot:m.340426 g.340426  ORF g.340426 m.340426 type:complete len:521 (+) comp19301_c0_seq1:20-1582(+)
MASRILLLLSLALPCSLALKLPKVFSSDMVMSAENPVVYGWSDPGDTVTMVLTGRYDKTYTTMATSDGRFLYDLPEQTASMEPYTLSVSAKGTMVNLTNILFGDVWVCSGQSNMEFSVAEMFDSKDIIANAAHPGLRLFAVQKNKSTDRLSDLVDIQYQQGWVEASPQTACGDEYGSKADFCMPHCGPSAAVKSFARPSWGYFSAVCMVHGISILKKTGRPQGMLESCWGGTPIEAWTSKEGAEMCNSQKKAADGDLYAGMINPLLNFPIKGAIWYQGEANSRNGNPYACQMKAMITDWRQKWYKSGNFTFGLVQLAPAGDSSGGILRWSQEAATSLPGVGMAVTIDLSDPGSPCGAVHIRNKTAVGTRLAKATYALAYEREVPTQDYSGPQVQAIDLQTSALVAYSAANNDTLQLASRLNGTDSGCLFEFTTESPSKTTWGGWASSPNAKINGNVVDVTLPNGMAAANIRGFRYAWGDVPNPSCLFVYDAQMMPAPMYIANCSHSICTSFPAGEVPNQK